MPKVYYKYLTCESSFLQSRCAVEESGSLVPRPQTGNKANVPAAVCII